jgi:two-component system, NtrC family, response regulator
VAHILIIDDDPLVSETIANVVRRMGHQATSVFNLQDGLEKTFSGLIDIVFLDVRLPDGNGLDVLPRIQAAPSSPEVIIMTGYGDPDGAELAIRHGAWDYIQKPSTVEAMTLPLVRALQYRQEKKSGSAPAALKRQGIVGNSPKMKTCLDLLAQVAPSDATALITGETGTGKELFALAIHENSSRARKSFIVVDCAALPENLVESILLGHEKGAYTGADKAEEGLILNADRGTLFLDEVGELPLSIQKSFLRVLQEKRFRPVGGKQEVFSDFRLIAASNRNLDEAVQQGKFRADLLFRLRSFTIDLPPLRERAEDIEDLATYYADILARRHAVEPKEFSPEFLGVLTDYTWPGNVRELINALERALVNGRQEPVLFPKHLPVHIRVQVARSSVGEKGKPDNPEPAPFVPAFPTIKELRDKALAQAEQKYLKDLISLTRGNIKEACRVSGLSRSRLYLLLKRYTISTSI